ncbi:MAG: hypothetical protein ACYSRP_00170 [Planctomycetota bacterium]|jgi:hypothetical protein
MNAPKKIYVMLAFHAHKPIRGFYDKLAKDLGDPELSAVFADADDREKDAAGADDDKANVYKELIRFSGAMEIPVALSVTNELLFQIRGSMPETYGALKGAYKEKRIFPIYTFAHNTQMVLIHPDEIINEIKLNREFLHYVLGVPHPQFRGVFPTDGSLDYDKLAGITQATMKFVALPRLDPSISRFKIEGDNDNDGDVKTFPFWIKKELLAVPINPAVSQRVIQLLMQGNPDVARLHGYPLGDFPVFTEEFLGNDKLTFPVKKDDMVSDYTKVLKRAVDECPDGGLILYMQELDPMGLGAQALEVLRESWKAVRDGGAAELKFVTPDGYLAEIKPRELSLPTVTFNQVSEMPGSRAVLQVDGLYPPRGVGDYRGVNVPKELYGRWPLIFRQSGCFMVEAVEVIYETLGIHFDIATTASKLADEGYDISRFDKPLQLAIHLRFIKGAYDWGAAQNEQSQGDAYVHLLCISQKIRENYADVLPLTVRTLPGSLEGMIKSLDILVQGRVDVLREGVGATKQENPQAVEGHLKAAEEKARGAKAALEGIVGKGDGQLTVDELTGAMASHARQVILAAGSLREAWWQCSNTNAMRDFCNKRLHETFPPKFPKLLEQLGRDLQGVR